MLVTLKVFRYNPEVDKTFHYETYTIENAQETDRMQLDSKRAGMLSIIAALLTPS